jgi:hypothetical protein
MPRPGAGCKCAHLGRNDAAMRQFKRGDDRDACISECQHTLSGHDLSGYRLLVGDQEPRLGSHLVTPRRGYLHHGIYVGARKVVHYSGHARGLHRGPVEEISFAHFARGHRIWVRSDAPSGANGVKPSR